MHWLFPLLLCAQLDPSIRVVSFNLYNRPLRRVVRLEQSQNILKNLKPDIVALQEVSKVLWWRNDPSVDLATALNLQQSGFWVDNALFLTSGLALLARTPLENSKLHRFEKNKFFDAKGFMVTIVETALGTLCVINVHLSSINGGAIKQHQFQALEKVILEANQTMSVLILGDFNEDATSPLFKDFLQKTKALNLFDSQKPTSNTWSGGYGKACNDAQSELLDYILIVPHAAQRFRFVDGGVFQSEKPYPSDHCPVWADIALEKTP